jgi:hypothetical protein
MSLVKSKKRVADHGEVFTPEDIVEAMLNLVKNESERIDSRFLEPACGSGNFLVEVLSRKIAIAERDYGKNVFERNHQAMLGLMCVYGIELLEDNARECRDNLIAIFSDFLGPDVGPEWPQAARVVVDANIIQGDAISMELPGGKPIVFPEWAYLGKGKFARRDFSYDSLTQRSSVMGTLFDLMSEKDIFIPDTTYPAMSVGEVAAMFNIAPKKQSGFSK